MARIIGTGELQRMHQQVCLKEGGCLGLIFGSLGAKEASSVKIIGQNDDPADWLAVARDVGRECVALFQMDKEEGMSLNGVNIRVMESICAKLANVTIAFAADDSQLLTNWAKGLSRAEKALISIMVKRGTMVGICNKALDAGKLAA